MGGVKNPFGGGNIGSTDQITGAAANPFGAVGEIGLGAIAGGKTIGGLLGGIDTSIKDPAGMQQYTDLANQAQQSYGNQQRFMQENVDPYRKSLLQQLGDQASGKAPSIAESQLKSAFDKSLQQQLAMARSGRGNAGLAARNVSNVANNQQQNLAQQGAIARLQERNAAQNQLANQLATEQNYGVNTLGAAMSGQANVAAMQNAQRAANDARNKGILEGGISAVGKFFGMANGGQVLPQFYAEGGQVSADNLKVRYDNSNPKKNVSFKSKNGEVQFLAKGGQVKKTFSDELACGGKVKKMADGGFVFGRTDTGDVSDFVKASKTQASLQNMPKSEADKGMTPEGNKEKKEDTKDSSGMKSLVKLAPLLFGAPPMAEGGEVVEPQIQKVSDMEDEEAKRIFKEKGSIALQIYLKNKAGKSVKEPQKKAEGGIMSQAGSVPGTAPHAGDDYKNDKVPAMLSPGEVVVPRSVIADGPQAAAHFVTKASNDKNYNAETYSQERPSFLAALKDNQQKEADYKKFKTLVKRK